MSKPKRIDADQLIRRYYETEGTEQEAFPEDTLAPVSRSSEETTPDATLSGGDVDAAGSGTDAGEETVGGSAPTPDQDVVDELGEAIGITYEDAEPLRFGDKLADRDARRWELNPASSEGYQERVQELASSEPVTPTRPQTPRQTQAAGTERGAPGRGKSRAKKTHKKKR
ncbi:MAG: hypothetical protein A4E19_19760 [Nitrospira sp. SG-bin1]|nr:MAG: hypothetical protein A4E19_19760 [Nitrospira sp. SG-bin1]